MSFLKSIEWDWWFYVLVGTILSGVMFGQLLGSATAGITVDLKVFGPVPWKWMFFFLVWWIGGFFYANWRLFS